MINKMINFTPQVRPYTSGEVIQLVIMYSIKIKKFMSNTFDL